MDQAEFDKFADEYRSLHANNIRVSGETPEFFAEYKVQDVRRRCDVLGLSPLKILDFGGGVGSSAPYFRLLFPDARIVIADVSSRSLEIAEARGISDLDCMLFDGRSLPAKVADFDIAFAACVFHHIDAGEHVALLREIRRVLKPDGRLWIFEHNPLNPLTVRAVNTCPFDENAVLIKSGELAKRVAEAGFHKCAVVNRIFFPGALRSLRIVEPLLAKVPFGAQYYVEACA